MPYLAAAFVALVAVVVFVNRRGLAQMQAAVLGGSVLPGCVVAQAVSLLLLAIVLVIAHLAGWV